MPAEQSGEKGILLESGTNELEIVEFTIGQGHFGINVMKVREIVEKRPLTKIPNANVYILLLPLATRLPKILKTIDLLFPSLIK